VIGASQPNRSDTGRWLHLKFFGNLYLPALLILAVPLVLQVRTRGRKGMAFVLAAVIGVLSMLMHSLEGCVLCCALLLTLSEETNRKGRVGILLTGLALYGGFALRQIVKTNPMLRLGTDIWTKFQLMEPAKAVTDNLFQSIVLGRAEYFSLSVICRFGVLPMLALMLAVVMMLGLLERQKLAMRDSCEQWPVRFVTVFFCVKVIVHLLNMGIMAAFGVAMPGVSLPLMGKATAVLGEMFLLCWATAALRKPQQAPLMLMASV